MVTILEKFLGLYIAPLSFLPSSIQIYFDFVTGFFCFLIAGKLVRWLWDILPIA